MVKMFLALLLLALIFAPLSASAQEDSPASPEAALAWSRVAVNGFGVKSNDTVWSLAAYKGRLYAGTRNPALGAQVWRTANGSTWTQVQSGGIGDTHNTAIASMAADDDFYLYLGTENSAGAEVWRTDGSTWTQINTNGFGDGNNTIAWSLGVDWYKLYVGTLNGANGADVWYYDQSTWTQLSAGLGANPANTIVSSLSARPDLAAGTWNQATGAQVWSYDSIAKAWTRLDADGPTPSNNWSARSMVRFKKDLYLGTFNSAGGAQVWRYDGANWARMANNGFGDSHNVGISSLFAYRDYLYAGTENTATGAEIWRSTDGQSWEQVNKDGFGSLGNTEAAALAGFGPYLFVGTRNSASGGEVWRVNLLGADQSFLISSQGRDLTYMDAVYNSRDREYLAAWTNYNPGPRDDDLQAQRLSWDGRLIGAPFWISSGNGDECTKPAGAYDSAHNLYLFTWSSRAGDTETIHARLFAANGNSSVPEFEIARHNTSLYDYDTVYWPEANEYLVLYSIYDYTTNQASLWGQMVTPGGTLDGAAFIVRQKTPNVIDQVDLEYNPARGEVLLVWSERNIALEDIYGMRMGWVNNPTALDAAFLIGGGAAQADYKPSVAALDYPSGSGEYLVAWSHQPYPYYTETLVRRVSGEGVPQGGPLGISTLVYGFQFARVIGLPLSRRYQVVWSDSPHDRYGSVLLARQVDRAGDPLGAPARVSGENVYTHALVRGPGDAYLVVYDDIPMGSVYRQVRGRVYGVKRLYLPLIR